MLQTSVLGTQHCIKAVHYGADRAGEHIQGDSRLVDITEGCDFQDLCDQKSSYKHVSDFGRLRSYDRLVAYLLRCQRYFRQLKRAIHNRSAASVAAGGGIFENEL